MFTAPKIAGVLLGAVALCGIGAGTALATTASTAAPAGHAPAASASRGSRVGAPMYSRGFHIYNLTSTPMTLQSVTGDGNFEGRPITGSVLQPGQLADFEVQYKWMSDQNDDITYTNGTSSFDARLTVAGLNDAQDSTCRVLSGSDLCDDSDDVAKGTNGDMIYLKEPAGTTVTYSGAQAQQQAAALNALCAAGADATCTFTPTSETTVNSPQHQIGDAFSNGSTVQADYTLARKNTVGVSDSVGVTATAGTNLFNIVDASISATYNHQWTTIQEFSEQVDAHVPANTKVWLEDAPEMIRDTGNFTITVGNTTINLTGVYFDSPDPHGNGNWWLMSQSLNGGAISGTPVS